MDSFYSNHALLGYIYYFQPPTMSLEPPTDPQNPPNPTISAPADPKLENTCKTQTKSTLSDDTQLTLKVESSNHNDVQGTFSPAIQPPTQQKTSKFWTPLEENTLLKAALQQNYDWQKISERFLDKTPEDCMQHHTFMNCLNQRRLWTKFEDQRLIELVHLYGENWTQVTEFFNKAVGVGLGRSGKQVKWRYLNYLRSDIVKTSWTKEEDQKLADLVVEKGKKWKSFESDFPGRSESCIKTRFYRHVKTHFHMDKRGRHQRKTSLRSPLHRGCPNK